MFRKTKTARSNSSLPVNKVARKALISGEMSRENILKSFNQNIIDKAWDALCLYITQNYESGRGTIIKGFGVFTYTSSEVNLEGTTNQFSRDKKGKRPVFIVSKEFNEYLKPGQYNPNSGLLIYYTQKQNNSLSHVRLNYAEIAYSLGIKKEECSMIIQNILIPMVLIITSITAQIKRVLYMFQIQHLLETLQQTAVLFIITQMTLKQVQ